MRLALLEFDAQSPTATGVRGRAIARHLRERGHMVDVLTLEPGSYAEFERSRVGLLSRVSRRLSGRRTLPHLWDAVADRLEPRLRAGGYDAAIARGQETALALSRGYRGLKILDLANVQFLEEYYALRPNLIDVEETYLREMKIFATVDHILCPHEILRAFLARTLEDRDLERKLLTVRLGCDPAPRHARFTLPPRIVYSGSFYYIQDPYLLAQLTKHAPYAIDCFGPRDPNRVFLPTRLNYRGFGATVDFLADYQFGLITVSRDELRQHSPATKFAYYFAHGLPVLFPAWMREGFTYPGCALPYEDSVHFVAQVEAASKPALWEQMSSAARRLADTLNWDAVLAPLSELLAADVGASR